MLFGPKKIKHNVCWYNNNRKKRKGKEKTKKYSLKGVGLAPKRGSCSNGERPLPKSLAIFF